MLTDELIDIWAEYDPVDGYAGGLEHCRGALFVPEREAVDKLRARVESARHRLDAINDADLRQVAGKILNCIVTDVRFPGAAEQVTNCAEGLFCILMKGDHGEGFVADFLRNVGRMLAFETRRLEGRALGLETRMSCLNGAAFLQETLASLEKANPGLSPEAGSVRSRLEDFKSLCAAPGIGAGDFEEVFALLKEKSAGPAETEGYSETFRDLYDYGMRPRELRRKAAGLLAEELKLAGPLAARVAEQLGLPADTRLGNVYEAVSARYNAGDDIIGKARQVMATVNAFTAAHIQTISPASFILPEPAPPQLANLITSGSAIVLNRLGARTDRRIHIETARNNSLLTMLNVLVHEGAHAYHVPDGCESDPSPLLKLTTYLTNPLAEGMAFHRELEFYECAQGLLGKRRLTLVEEEFMSLFGDSHAARERAVRAFGLETRIWRIARFVRAVFDVDVNLGDKDYPGFIDWAQEQTTLSKEFLHQQCISFIGLPGFAPSYAMGGTRYGEIQAGMRARGVSRKTFNTRACCAGFWPLSMFEKKMSEAAARP